VNVDPGVVALMIWLAAAAVYRWLALRFLGALLESRASDGEGVPPSGEVVLLRPLRDAGQWLESCLESLWNAAELSHSRVVLGLTDPRDPARNVVQEALAGAERPPTQLRIDPGPAGLNRKMANLIQMTDGLEADILLFSDADVRVPEDYVDHAVAPFKETEVGLVTFPYRSIPGSGLASRVEALITNTHFLPSVAMALEVEGLHFGLGASIGVRREALERAGGLEALLGVCGDDYQMARNIDRAGYRLELVPLVLEHLLEGAGWHDAVSRQLRWARVVRDERPLGYLGQIVTHGSVPALALGALAAFSFAGAAGWLLPLSWWGAQAAGLWRRRRILALRTSDLLLLPVVDIAAFLIWAGGFFGRPRPS
jgi:ceramide glucosyltransferase